MMLLMASAYGQEEDQKRFRRPNKFIGVTFSVARSYRILSSEPSTDFIKSDRDAKETPILSYSGGIRRQFPLGKKSFSIEAGLLYALRGYDRGKEVALWPHPTAGLPTHFSYKYRFHYVDVPIALRWSFNIGNVTLYTSGGTSVNVALASKTYQTAYYLDGSSSTNSNNGLAPSGINIAGTFSLGWAIPFTRRSDLRIDAFYHNSIIPIATGTVREYSSTFGINLGYYFAR